jgi:hypothetical protein
MSEPPCRFCGRKARLCRSHVIPEFCFSTLYDKDHRFIEVVSVDEGKVRRGQKGYREKLLCDLCETRLNRLERHARRLFVDPLPNRKSPRRIDVTNLDYGRFKLFLMSVLWRASVSSLGMFRHVTLGPHEERVRRMLQNEDPGSPEEYGCVIIPLLFEGEHFRDFMVEPTPCKVDGRRCYRFVFFGFVFLVFVSSHGPPPTMTKLLIRDDRPIEIYPTELHELRF